MSTNLEVPSSVPASLRSLRGLSPEQYDVALLRIGLEIDEALEAGQDGRIPLLLEINRALEEERAEAIDGIVKLMLFLAGQEALNDSQARLFKEQAETIGAALGKIRVHIQDYIDRTKPADHRKIAGKVCKLWTQANPKDSLIISDDTAVPAELYNYEMTVRVPVRDGAIETLMSIQDFAVSFAPDGTSTEIRTAGPERNLKLVLDENRVREHLEQHSETWGRIEQGRHLRMRPSMADAKKAMVKL